MYGTRRQRSHHLVGSDSVEPSQAVRQLHQVPPTCRRCGTSSTGAEPERLPREDDPPGNPRRRRCRGPGLARCLVRRPRRQRAGRAVGAPGPRRICPPDPGSDRLDVGGRARRCDRRPHGRPRRRGRPTLRRPIRGGTGVATALLRRAEDAIRAAGHGVAWLAVVPGNDRARASTPARGGETPAPSCSPPTPQTGRSRCRRTATRSTSRSGDRGDRGLSPRP